MTPGSRQASPDSGLLGVIARLALIGSAAAVLVATVYRAPHVIYSYNLEHFAAFYLVSVIAAVANPHTRLRRLAAYLVAFAVLAEGVRLFWALPEIVLQRCSADIGGMMAAYVPMFAYRLRRRFHPIPVAVPPTAPP